MKKKVLIPAICLTAILAAILVYIGYNTGDLDVGSGKIATFIDGDDYDISGWVVMFDPIIGSPRRVTPTYCAHDVMNDAMSVDLYCFKVMPGNVTGCERMEWGYKWNRTYTEVYNYDSDNFPPDEAPFKCIPHMGFRSNEEQYRLHQARQ